jgi:hypothetical protein
LILITGVAIAFSIHKKLQEEGIMRPSIVSTAVVALFSFCLTMSCFCGAAAGMEHGTASCAGQKVTPGPNGTFNCQVPLPAHPPLGKGAGNPNDWGMCGVLSLSGFFNSQTAAQIVVGSNGYYAVDLKYTSANDTAAKHWPELGWTCVFFREFTTVPAVSDATYFAQAGYSGPSPMNITGSKGYACIWAGVSGALTDIDSGAYQMAGGNAYAQFRSPVTVIEGYNDTSYAFCSGYKAAAWTGWKYLISRNMGDHTNPATYTLNESKYWCYMDGVIASWNLQISFPGPIQPAINISSSGDYSLAGIYDNGGGDFVGLSMNCLPLAQ